MKLIVADDDVTTRMVVSRVAATTGHEVRVVSNGRELTEEFARAQADAILVDWEMPELGGLDAVHAIRSRADGGRVVVVVVTGVSDELDPSAAIEAGVDDFLLKPISGSRLRMLFAVTEARVKKRRC